MLDLIVTCDHAVHDLANLARQDWQICAVLLLVGFVEVISDRDVHATQPRGEAIKQRLQLDAWCLAFKQVNLVVVRELLVILALLVNRHVVPCLEVFHAKPLEQRVHVVLDLLRRIRLHCHVGVHGQEEVRGLVQEGRVVALLGEDRHQALRIKAAACRLHESSGLDCAGEEALDGSAVRLVKCQRSSRQIGRRCSLLDGSLLLRELTDLRRQQRVAHARAARRFCWLLYGPLASTKLIDLHSMIAEQYSHALVALCARHIDTIKACIENCCFYFVEPQTLVVATGDGFNGFADT